MNFKTSIFLLSLLILLGCGVKSSPAKPPETAIQAYFDSYTTPITTPITIPTTEKEKNTKPSVEKKK